MRASDASVAVAAFASWHPRHRPARSALGGDATITAHAALETYSVLTRLPEPFRARPATANEFLAHRFPDEHLQLSVRAQKEMLGRLAELGIAGGAVYDALIAETARAHGATLLSLDRRAAMIYERVGVEYELIG